MPVATSKTFRNLSAAPLARYLPSRENSTPKTVSLWASLISRSSVNAGMFHSLSSPLRDGSPPPVASSVPAGLKARQSTRPTNEELPVSSGASAWGPMRPTKFPRGIGLPQREGSIVGGGEHVRVADEDESADRRSADFTLERPARFHVPKLNVRLVAARGEHFAVGGKGQSAKRPHAASGGRGGLSQLLVGVFLGRFGGDLVTLGVVEPLRGDPQGLFGAFVAAHDSGEVRVGRLCCRLPRPRRLWPLRRPFSSCSRRPAWL